MILNLAIYYSVTYVKFERMTDKTREYRKVFSVSGFGTRQKTVWVWGSRI
jgi:hypothetical protein